MPNLYEAFQLTARGATDWSVAALTTEHEAAWDGASTFEGLSERWQTQALRNLQHRERLADFPVRRYVELLLELTNDTYRRQRPSAFIMRTLMPRFRAQAREQALREQKEARYRDAYGGAHQARSVQERAVYDDLWRKLVLQQADRRTVGVSSAEWEAQLHAEFDETLWELVRMILMGPSNAASPSGYSETIEATIDGKAYRWEMYRWEVRRERDQHTHEKRYAESARPWDFRPVFDYTPFHGVGADLHGQPRDSFFFADLGPDPAVTAAARHPDVKVDSDPFRTEPVVDPTAEPPAARSRPPHWQRLNDPLGRRRRRRS